jgi:diguanylate cyclase (GGDEF)-like protein
VQEVAWSLVIVVPLLLLVWVIVLFRMLMRLRHLRGSAGLLTAASELGLSPREIASLSPAALERLRDQLALDDLTGCMRRASGLASLERELARARREKSTLAIGFIDADGLKHANDTLGHAAGDQLLKEVSAGLRSRLRGSDFVFRYGGDEFVCVMPGAHSGDAAAVLTDVQAHLRLHGRSFSLGIAEFLPADTAVTLLGRADEALYAAKRALRGGAETSGAGGPRTGAVARPSQATAR